MKKRNINWKRILLVLILLAFLGVTVLLYGKVDELTNQLVYLQDTTNIILSDVGGMQSNIEKTLEEQTSMVEDYSIKVTDMDFAKNVYKVAVTVIPKEYTDSTTMSIYFGTIECPLKADGYRFKGNISLPLEKTFDGNVTFLLANGKKKTTEVVEDFAGVSGMFDQVLSGRLDGSPVLKAGKLSLKGKCTYQLENAGMYAFKEFWLVAALDGEEIWSEDLMQETLQDQDEASKTEEELVTTEQAVETDSSDHTIESSSGTDLDFKMVCELPEEDATAAETEETSITDKTQQLRIYLCAVTTEGYRFETDLLRESLVTEAGKQYLDKEHMDTTMYRSVYDRKGNERTIDP